MPMLYVLYWCPPSHFLPSPSRPPLLPSPSSPSLPSISPHQGIKAIMKDVARFLPGIGWTFVFMEYPFLKRDWRQDEAALIQSCNNLKDYPVNMLVRVPVSMYIEGDYLHAHVFLHIKIRMMKYSIPAFPYTPSPPISLRDL